MATNSPDAVRAVTDGVEKKYGLPEGLLFKMAHQESRFNSDAVSPKGARGVFQFMPETAAHYGVTDPTDLAQAADGAGRYMSDNMTKYKGNVSESLADYNGGPRAVKALRNGTPFDETSGYLKGILGDSPPAAVPQAPSDTPPTATISPQFTSGSAAPTTLGTDAVDLAGKRAFADSQRYRGQLPEDLAKSWKLDNSVYNYFQTKALADSGPEQDLTDETAKGLLSDVPQRHWDYVLQGRNDAERTARKGKVAEALKTEEELAAHGIVGMGARMSASLLDLPTLLAFVPVVGGSGVMTAAGRVSNAVRMGLVGGVSIGAVEAATYQNRPLGTTHDIYMAAAMGVGFGALTGGLSNPAKFRLHEENARIEDFARREVNDGHLREIGNTGQEPTAAYKKFLEGLEGQKKRGLQEIDAKLRDWSIGQPRDVNVPVNGPSSYNPKTGILARRAGPEEPPVRAPIEEPRVPEAPPAAPKPPPVDVPNAPGTGPRWQEADFGPGKNLILEGKTVNELAEYTRLHSQNPGLVSVLDRVLKAIDLRKLDFRVIGKGQKWSGRSAEDLAMQRALGGARGAVMTPPGSIGDDLKMFLRSEEWGHGQHGMNEETFTHELVHAAAVYKQNAHAQGLISEPGIEQAARDLRSLNKTIRTSAKKTFGATWEEQLNQRLGINLKNDKELLAYGLTNAAFQDFLKTVKLAGSPDKTLWGHFVKALRGLLGIDAKDHNALSRLVELSGPLTSKGGVSKNLKVTNNFTGVGSIDAATVAAANQADIPIVFGFGLGLEHRLGGASMTPAVRSEAAKLFGTTVGYKDHSVVKANAWDMTNTLADSWAVKLRKDAYPAFEDWFKQSKRGSSEKGQAYDEFGTQVSDYVRDISGTYPPQVMKAGEAVRAALAEAAEHINNPSRANGGKKMGLTETKVKDPVTGVETIQGTLAIDKNYLPRKHDISKWNAVHNQFGRDALEGWWADAYKSARVGVSDADAKQWSGWYVRTVEEAHANRTQDLLGDILQGSDKDALMNSLMRNGGYSHFDALKIMDDMLPSKGTDNGALMSSLKHRNTIDEKFSMNLTDRNGQTVKLGINDFTNSNALDSIEPYLRRTAGNVALAEHLDVYKTGHIAERIAAATENKLGDSMKSATELKGVRDNLQYAYDRIQALPQEEITGLNKSMEMWRDFNVIRLMGGTVWNQATEMGQIVGSMGWKTMLQAMPELKAMSRDFATGKAPNEILEHLENTIGGAGSEYIKRMTFKNADDWVRMKGDTAWNRRLDKFDTKLKQFAKGTLDYTGMTGLMVQQKRVHAIALVNHFINDATGKQASTFLTKDRLAWMGIGEQEFISLKASLKQYSSPTKGQFSATHKVDFDAWVKNSPDTHARFMEAIHRESRRVIQENDLGSMIPIMGTTLGKTMFQFMNFTMHGWNKSLMFSANHRDFATLSTVLHGGLLSAMTYMGRTMMGSMGMDAETKQAYLDKRLAPKQLVANSIGRISQASLLPNLYDSTLGNLTGPMFSGMRTTSDVSSLASNPTLSAINSTLSLMKIGKNSISGESQTTQHDVKQWGKLLPLNNVAPISTLLNSIANDYPTSSVENP